MIRRDDSRCVACALTVIKGRTLTQQLARGKRIQCVPEASERLAFIGRRASIRVAQPRHQVLLLKPTEPRRLRRAAKGHLQVLQEGIDGDGMTLAQLAHVGMNPPGWQPIQVFHLVDLGTGLTLCQALREHHADQRLSIFLPHPSGFEEPA
jgi:hypothetical protein